MHTSGPREVTPRPPHGLPMHSSVATWFPPRTSTNTYVIFYRRTRAWERTALPLPSRRSSDSASTPGTRAFLTSCIAQPTPLASSPRCSWQR